MIRLLRAVRDSAYAYDHLYHTIYLPEQETEIRLFSRVINEFPSWLLDKRC